MIKFSPTSNLTNADADFFLKTVFSLEISEYLNIAFVPMFGFLGLWVLVFLMRRFLFGKNENNVSEQNNTGLGGWLIIVGLGIITAPTPIIIQTFQLFNELFANGGELFQLELGVKAHNPLWEAILFGLLVTKGAIALVWLYIGFLFFTKKKVFPKWYVGILLFLIAFIFVVQFAKQFMHPGSTLLNNALINELTGSIVWALIFIPYMLYSKRVKGTFIN